ncbi:class I SAM-dependent methyltransferase [Acinetobacter sp. GXMZU3951]
MGKDFNSQQVVDGYDEHIRKLIPGYELTHQQVDAILSHHYGEQAQVQILVVGCGTGYELQYLAQKHPNWQFTAIDPSHVMLCKAKQRLEKHGVLHRVRFIHGDTKSLANEPMFDAVLSILVAHFIPLESKQSFFKDIFSGLKPNGMLLTYDLMKESEAHEVLVLKQFCENNGLSAGQSEKMVERLQHDFFLVSPKMGQQLLSNVGFKKVKTYSQLMNYYGFCAVK